MGRNHRQENLERLGNWSIENKINNWKLGIPFRLYRENGNELLKIFVWKYIKISMIHVIYSWDALNN
jgi:hypothetical protein